MPIKKSKTASGFTVQNTYPFGSPFCSPIVYIKANSATLYVHQALVESASPKLLDRFRYAHDEGSGKDVLIANLNSISLEVGHTLVKWLYSGTYSLRERQKTEVNTLVSPFGFRSSAETLRIAFGVYSLAREFDLSGLEVLARQQISRFGPLTDVFTFIDVIEEAYPRTVGTHDAWLEEYITTRMKAALKEDRQKNIVKTTTNETEAIGQGEEEAQNIPISKLLVQGMLEACRDVVRQIPKLDVYDRGPRTDDDPVPTEAPVEVVPEVFALAVETSNTTEVLAPPAEKSTRSSDNDDWVFPSPKGKEVTVAKEPIPEPEPSVPEPTIEDDPWAAWGSSVPKKKKKKKDKKVLVEEEPAPEPEPEPEVEPEMETAALPEPEPVAMPEPLDEVDVPPRIEKGKKKKKVKREVDPEPEPPVEVPDDQEVPAAMAEAEVEDEPKDVWGFWGARKSPRQSLS